MVYKLHVANTLYN